MDKQEAIAYIHQMLDQDHTLDEIVRNLAAQLHAPETMVAKFVAQIEAEYRKNKPPTRPTPVTPQPFSLPPWLEELSTGKPPVATAPNATVSAVNAPPSWEEEARAFAGAQLKIGRLHSDIADELADRIGIPLIRAEAVVASVAAQVGSSAQTRITNTAQAAEFVNAEYARGRPKLEIAAELAARTGEAQTQTQKFVDLTIAKAEKATPQESIQPAKPSIDLNKPELVNWVVGELVKNHKRSDIVMAVCERTGVEWSEAQRFVGQVSAEQHTKINARKNRLIVPLCISAIGLGLLLTLISVLPMIYVINGRTAEFLDATRSVGGLANFVQFAPYIFLTGIAMIGGGVIGLVMALRSQME